MIRTVPGIVTVTVPGPGLRSGNFPSENSMVDFIECKSRNPIGDTNARKGNQRVCSRTTQLADSRQKSAYRQRTVLPVGFS
jgi:hypothetical protein